MINKGCINPIEVDEIQIIKLYTEDSLTMESIAKEMNCSPSTIKRRLVKSGVPLRTKEESLNLRKSNINTAKAIYLYNRGFTLEEVANEENISATCLKRKFTEIRFIIRNRNDSQRIKADERLRDRDWLINEYVNLKKSPRQIAKENQISLSSVAHWVEYHEIEKRNLKEALSLLDRTGANSHMFGKEPPHGKGRWVVLNGENVYMKSTWEIDVSKYLLLNGYNFKYEKVRFNLGRSTYRPDFFIYDSNEKLIAVIEVKGWVNDVNTTKMMTFQTLYPEIDYYIWDKEVIDLLRQEAS